MKKIGIIIELELGRVSENTLSMISLARVRESELFAFVIGEDVKVLKDTLEEYGITHIVNVVLPPGQLENPAIRAKAIENCIIDYGIGVLFGLSTARGKDLLPRIAAGLGSPLVMNCVDVDLERNIARTYRYSGKTIASIQLTGEVVVFGIRANAIVPVPSPVSSIILNFDATDIKSRGFRFLAAEKTEVGTKVSLSEAELIIAGGRGMKSSDNFAILLHCAEKLSGGCGASRAAVDAGWVPHSMQIGQTGEKVSPKVYIACGISGSVQHYAGMQTSRMIIAINTDINASIMSNCDYYVHDDALKILPLLLKHLDTECAT